MYEFETTQQSNAVEDPREEELQRLREECYDLEQKLCQAQEDLQKEREDISRTMSDRKAMEIRSMRTLVALLTDAARREHTDERKYLMSEQDRLGKCSSASSVHGGVSRGMMSWEGGVEEDSIARVLQQVAVEKQEVEREKANIRRIKRLIQQTMTKENMGSVLNGAGTMMLASNAGNSLGRGQLEDRDTRLTDSNPGACAEDSRPKLAKRHVDQSVSQAARLHIERSPGDIGNQSASMQVKAGPSLIEVEGQQLSVLEAEALVLETRESLVLIEGKIKQSEDQIRDRQRKLLTDRMMYMKRIKTHRAQDISAFAGYKRYGDGGRYQLLNLIGKGGFSEVFKAYDLQQHTYVALKINQVKRDMTDDMRSLYIARTLSECSIHRSLVHRRIVRLYDFFSIDSSSFATVLEYCEGVDLDTYIKTNGPMSEKEARGVIIQLLSALRYMYSCPGRVIHYDLKPGNIMYHRGRVKVADFGLAKSLDPSNASDTMEMTADGAGTYWYLPPECFAGLTVVDRNGEPATGFQADGQRRQSAGNRPAPPAPTSNKISNKVDVWSLGVIFFELLFAKRPFCDGEYQENVILLMSRMVAGDYKLEFPFKISKQAEEFIRRLLTVDRTLRPDVTEASSDPYVFPASTIFHASTPELAHIGIR